MLIIQKADTLLFYNESGEMLFKKEGYTFRHFGYSSTPFEEGVCILKNTTGRDSVLGINKKGETVFKLKGKAYSLLYNGLTYYQDGAGGYSYIDAKGAIAFPKKFRSVSTFSEGIASVQEKKGEAYSYINQKGEVLFQKEERVLGGFNSGLARTRNKETEKFGFIDKTGALIIPENLHRVYDFDEGLAVMMDESGKYGVINTKGEQVLAPSLSWLDYKYKNGFLKARGENPETYGFIDRKGNWVVEPLYQIVSHFEDGWAIVKKAEDEHFIVIDTTGKLVFKTPFTDESIKLIGNRILKVNKRGVNNYGYYKWNGDLIVHAPPEIIGFESLKHTEQFDPLKIRKLTLNHHRNEKLNTISKQKSIPEEILKYKNLEELSFKSHLLDAFPKGLCNLTKLEKLHLQDNKIKDIISEISNLKNLKHLNLSYNQISEWDDVFFTLIDLEVLDLDGNPICSNPELVQKLKMLFQDTKLELRPHPGYEMIEEAVDDGY